MLVLGYHHPLTGAVTRVRSIPIWLSLPMKSKLLETYLMEIESGDTRTVAQHRRGLIKHRKQAVVILQSRNTRQLLNSQSDGLPHNR